MQQTPGIFCFFRQKICGCTGKTAGAPLSAFAASELTGCIPGTGLKTGAECTGTGKSAPPGNLLYRHVCCPQQIAGIFQSDPDQILMGGYSGFTLKNMGEIIGVHVCMAGQLLQCNILVKMLTHITNGFISYCRSLKFLSGFRFWKKQLG